MANIVQYGFKPHRGGQSSNHQVLRFKADGTNNSTNIFVGDVVQVDSAGGIKAGTAAAHLGNLGVVVGIYDSNGIPIAHPSSSITTKYLAASTAAFIDVALALPGALFVGQSLGTSYAATDVFAGVDLVATAGNTTTAASGHNLGSASTGVKDFILLGAVDAPTNALGSINCDMLVMFLSSIFGQGAGLGV